jgi:hypothetical protein
MPAPTSLELSVSACNLAGLCSPAQSISLPLNFDRHLEASIVGLPSTMISSAKIALHSKVNYTECGLEKMGPNVSVSDWWS